MTQRRRALAVVGVLLAVAVTSATTVGAQQAKPARAAPQGPAKVRFAADFPKLVDSEWRFPLGGFGGIRRDAPITRAPVVFVHGNNVDHTDWYPVRDAFRRAGWTDQELWALSYNGLGGTNGTALRTPNPEAQDERREMGYDGITRVTENDVNVPDLHAFLVAVRAYTGSRRFHLVGHSLGVTLARRTLQVHRDLRADLVSFVGIAGANHGTSLCAPGTEGRVVSCDEIAAGTAWLAALNGVAGADETYPPARWLTVYDGSGAGDPAYAGPTYAQSPALRGADNRQFAGTYHNDLRLDPTIVAQYRAFVEAADRAAGGAGPRAVVAPGGSAVGPSPTSTAPPGRRGRAGGGQLPATGGDGPFAAAAVAGTAALLLRRLGRPGRRERPRRQPRRWRGTR